MPKFDKNPKVAAGLLASLSVLLWAGSLSAQTNAPRPKFPPNRFLFVVDTSRGMERRAEGTLKAMQELLLSEVNGQMRSGDSMAIWTFNDDLHAGQFPLKLWTTQTRRNVLVGAVTFLKDQKYEKQGSLDKVLPQIQWVIKNSEFITVILITDGSEKLTGTPFDERINEYCRVWQKEQFASRMPFLTLLRAKKGRITDYSVSAYPWPLDVPALPPELLVAREPPNPEPKKLPPPIVQPLIVTGKKPQPLTAEPQISQPAPEVSRTNNASAPMETSTTTPPVKGPEGASLAQVKPEDTSTQPGRSGDHNASAASEPSHTTASAQEATRLTTPAPAPGTAAPVVAEPPRSAADKSQPQSTSTATDLRQRAPAETTASAAPAEGQVALLSNTLFNQRNLLIGGAVVLLIAAAMTALFLRRPRPASPTSLITRSLERENTPAPPEHAEGSER